MLNTACQPCYTGPVQHLTVAKAHPKKERDETPTALGLRILRCRTERHLTQDQLAAKLGVTKGAVSQWECGKTKNLKLVHIFKLSDALDVAARWLAIGEGQMQRPKVHPDAVSARIDELAHRIAGLPESEQELLLKVFDRRGSGRD